MKHLVLGVGLTEVAVGCTACDTILYTPAEHQQQDTQQHKPFVADLLQSCSHLNINTTVSILLNNTSVCGVGMQIPLQQFLFKSKRLICTVNSSWQFQTNSSLTVNQGKPCCTWVGFVSPICHDVSQAGRKQSLRLLSSPPVPL